MSRLQRNPTHLAMAAVLGCSFLASATLSQTQAPPAASQPSSRGNRPALVDACLITRDVKRLVRFYEPILQSKAKWSGQDYAELATSAGVLAIFSSSAQEKYIPGSAEAAKNRTVILEFEVADVDAEYKRLQDLVKIWVKAPTTQPWGTRSIYFRDPDSNLINFFTHLPAP